MTITAKKMESRYFCHICNEELDERDIDPDLLSPGSIILADNTQITVHLVPANSFICVVCKSKQRSQE